jgi:hypothetical protein
MASRAASYAARNACAVSPSRNLIAKLVRFSSPSEKSSAMYVHVLSLSGREPCEREKARGQRQRCGARKHTRRQLRMEARGDG